MTTTRKTARRSGTARKSTAFTKAKMKRVARKAKASLDVAAHDAGLALQRTARKLKRTAQKLETKFSEAKGPAKRRARRVGRKVASAVESAGESISAAARKAKSRLTPARRTAGAKKGARRKIPA